MKTKMQNQRLTAASSGKGKRENTKTATLQLRGILVPMDFSGKSRQALDFAMPLAEQYGGKITLIHVVEPLVYPSELGMVMVHAQNATEASQKDLQALSQKLIPAGLRGGLLVRTGVPYNEITRAASQLKADLIVLTTHGHTGLKHVMLGSTAERVVRHAHCPVLTVRRH